MAACLGACATGVRAVHRHVVAGPGAHARAAALGGRGRHPVVMADVNRAMGPGWNIWTDQNDSLAQRDTGWIQLYCETNQEVLDTTIQAFRLAEAVDLPVMVILDAFFLSHTSASRWTSRSRSWWTASCRAARRASSWTPTTPARSARWSGPTPTWRCGGTSRRPWAGPRGVFEEVDADWKRPHRPRATAPSRATAPRTPSSSWSPRAPSPPPPARWWTAAGSDGEKVGLVKVKMFRPFPTAALRRAAAGGRRVAVLDRNISPGHGGIFAEEIRSRALRRSRSTTAPRSTATSWGSGGRDVTPETIDEVDRRGHGRWTRPSARTSGWG